MINGKKIEESRNSHGITQPPISIFHTKTVRKGKFSFSRPFIIKWNVTRTNTQYVRLNQKIIKYLRWNQKEQTRKKRNWKEELNAIKYFCLNVKKFNFVQRNVWFCRGKISMWESNKTKNIKENEERIVLKRKRLFHWCISSTSLTLATEHGRWLYFGVYHIQTFLYSRTHIKTAWHSTNQNGSYSHFSCSHRRHSFGSRNTCFGFLRVNKKQMFVSSR